MREDYEAACADRRNNNGYYMIFTGPVCIPSCSNERQYWLCRNWLLISIPAYELINVTNLSMTFLNPDLNICILTQVKETLLKLFIVLFWMFWEKYFDDIYILRVRIKNVRLMNTSTYSFTTNPSKCRENCIWVNYFHILYDIYVLI